MRRVSRTCAIPAIVAAGLLGLLGNVQAETAYGITTTGALVTFDTANPNAVTTIGPVTGVSSGHLLRGVDFRPANGLLYAMSTVTGAGTAQLYTIDLATAAATPVGAGLTLTGNTSTRVSLDFNPVVNALRVVTGGGQSYRVNANTGSLIAQDTSIIDVGSGATPLISGIAYTNNVVGATTTTLYAYDFLADNLGRIGGLNGPPSPNGGAFTVIGNSGIVTGDAGLGFDISGATGMAYVSVDDFNGSAGFAAEFFSINLATGTLTQLSNDDFAPLLDFSIVAVPNPGSLAMMAAGLGLLGATLRRRRGQGA